MASILVDTDWLKNQSTELKSLANKCGKISDSLHTIDRSLSWKIKGYGSIHSSLISQCNNMTLAKKKCTTLSGSLLNIAELYERIEQNNKNVEKITGINNGKNESTREQLLEELNKIFQKITGTIETGVAKIIDFTKQTVQSIISLPGKLKEDYENKGLTYKVLQTGKATLSIIGAGSSIVAMWGADALSGGVGTAICVVGTTYAGNSILNSGADLYNIWFGDINEVGDTNLLKEGMESAGSAIGSLFGNEGIGKTIGNTAYNAGGLVYIFGTAEALYGKIVQSPNLWDSIKNSVGELKNGADGLWYLASNVNLSELKLQYTLLQYEIPNIKETISTIGLFVESGKNLKEVADAVVDSVNSVLKYCFQ